MKEPKDLVPPLDLCRLIPDGEFEDAALCWVEDFERNYNIKKYVITNDQDFECLCWIRKICNAPTAEEILIEIKKCGGELPDVILEEDGWEAFCSDEKMEYSKYGKTASEAALRLWLQLKGIEVDE